MRKLLFSLLPCLAYTTCLAQAPELSHKVLDFGTVPLRSKNHSSVTLYNRTAQPIVIRAVTVDCTCTKASWAKTPVLPGDSTRIAIQFNPTSTGAFYKTLRISTHPPAPLPLEVVLRGKVAP